MPASNPFERRLIARAAAHQSWATTPDRTARTSNARAAFLAKFEDQVDPGRELTPEERTKRAANARKAYFANLARKSSRSRHGDAARRQALEELAEATSLLAAVAERGVAPVESTSVATPIDVPIQSGGTVG